MENNGSLNAELALVIAELLFENGELLDNKESNKSFMQALLLFYKVLENPKVAIPFEDLQKISFIENTLDSLDIEKVKQHL